MQIKKQQTNKLTDADNRVVITSREGGGEDKEDEGVQTHGDGD